MLQAESSLSKNWLLALVGSASPQPECFFFFKVLKYHNIQKIKRYVYSYLVHGICFGCYTKGSNGEILKDFKEGVIILCILEILFWVQCRDLAGEGHHRV